MKFELFEMDSDDLSANQINENKLHIYIQEIYNEIKSFK